MKLKELESLLQDVKTFESPKQFLEQYITTPHLASNVLHLIDQSYDDIQGKVICDLGVGTGMLSIGCCLLGADYVLGVDIDSDALAICQQNIEQLVETNNVDLVRCDCNQLFNDNGDAKLNGQFDTVVMNPPFGTRQNGIDMKFLRVAASLSRGVIYSMNKSSTRAYIQKFSKSLGWQMKVVYQMKYNIPKVESRNPKLRHNAPEIDIDVDLLRFEKC